MTNPPDPKEALAAIDAARRTLPGDMKHPLGYDLAYGLVCGLLVAGQGLPQPWSALVLAVSLAGLALLVHWWRSQHGWWINGYSPRRARWIAISLAAVLIGLMGLSIWGRIAGVAWTPLATGTAGGVAAIVGGRLWMRVWRRELEGTAA